MLVDTDGICAAIQKPRSGWINSTNSQSPPSPTWNCCRACATALNSLRCKSSLAQRKAERLPITPAITERAIALMEGLALSHGMQMGDALIVATAIEHNLPVLTANVKHFGSVDGLRVERFEPN